MDRTGNILDNTNTPELEESAAPYWKQAVPVASTPAPTKDAEATPRKDLSQIMSRESYAATATSPAAHVTPANKAQSSANRFGGAVLTLIIVVVAIAIGVLVWRKLPRTFQACTAFPGSKTADGRCTTFYNKVFVDWPGGNSSSEVSDSLDAVLTQTATDSATPTPTEIAQSTTKGGIALSPTPIAKPTASKPTTKPVPSTTQAPASSGDWIKHNYPDQNLSLFVPRNYTGSNAVRNRDTGITTFKLWTTNGTNPEVAFKLQAASSVSDAEKNKPANTSVAGNPASKSTSGSTTVYTWQKNDIFYTATCTTEAKMCDEIMGKVEVR